MPLTGKNSPSVPAAISRHEPSPVVSPTFVILTVRHAVAITPSPHATGPTTTIWKIGPCEGGGVERFVSEHAKSVNERSAADPGPTGVWIRLGLGRPLI